MDKPVRTTTQAEVAAPPWTRRMGTYKPLTVIAVLLRRGFGREFAGRGRGQGVGAVLVGAGFGQGPADGLPAGGTAGRQLGVGGRLDVTGRQSPEGSAVLPDWRSPLPLSWSVICRLSEPSYLAYSSGDRYSLIFRSMRMSPS
jgi:hypothetical protein